MSVESDAADRRETVQESLRTGEFETTSFGSPEHGTVIELLMCEYLGLTYVDGESVDGLDSDGRSWQIKACREEHSNGGDETVPGRWDVWSEGLLDLLHDDGGYLLVVYDGDVRPEDASVENLDEYVLAWKFVDAAEFGGHIDPGAWHEANRPSKGRRARVFWTDLFDGVGA